MIKIRLYVLLDQTVEQQNPMLLIVLGMALVVWLKLIALTLKSLFIMDQLKNGLHLSVFAPPLDINFIGQLWYLDSPFTSSISMLDTSIHTPTFQMDPTCFYWSHIWISRNSHLKHLDLHSFWILIPKSTNVAAHYIILILHMVGSLQYSYFSCTHTSSLKIIYDN